MQQQTCVVSRLLLIGYPGFRIRKFHHTLHRLADDKIVQVILDVKISRPEMQQLKSPPK